MNKTLLRLKERLKKTSAIKVKRFFDSTFARPVITQAWFPPINPSLNKTLLICVEATFNQNIHNAGHLMPLGFAQGWTEAAGGAKFIFVKDLLREIEQHEDVYIFICQHSLRHFSFQEARKLRGKNMFVWVHVHPRAFGQFEKENLLISQLESDLYYEGYTKLLVAEPKFVWNAVGQAGMRWFEGWKDDGLRWETIFPGANSAIYFPEPSAKYAHIKIGYVGGYWEEKAQAFTSYLRQWEDDFVPFGYSNWPYKNYGGGLTEANERNMYSSAGLIPLVTSPAGWSLAEITERYLKAPACRAFCIADQNPAVRDLFNEQEMLQASSADHFHHLVNEFKRDKIDVEYWKEVGYQATINRHLVKHRAEQILRALEVLSA
jgi:hypothetical protein